MNALAMTLLFLAPTPEEELSKALGDVLTRATKLQADRSFDRCAGLCEGALRAARGRVKDAKVLGRIEVGLAAAELEPTAEERAGRLVKLLAAVSKGLTVEVKTPKGGDALSAEEQQMLDALNARRKKEDLAPLRPNPKLMAAARAHSANMARQDKMAHELDDKTPADRVKEAGYAYRAMGENVAAGQRTAAEVTEGWMESPPHRKNMLNGAFEEVGLAVADSKDGKRYWTQVFGAALKR